MRHWASSLLLILLAGQLALGLPVMRAAPLTHRAPQPPVSAPSPHTAAMHCHVVDSSSTPAPAPQPVHPSGTHDCCGAHAACHCSAAPGVLAQLSSLATRAPRPTLLTLLHPPVVPQRTDELFRPPILT